MWGGKNCWFFLRKPRVRRRPGEKPCLARSTNLRRSILQRLFHRVEGWGRPDVEGFFQRECMGELSGVRAGARRPKSQLSVLRTAHGADFFACANLVFRATVAEGFGLRYQIKCR